VSVSFELQPCIRNELIRLEPLRPEDFEALYAVASDPLIWEQHPSKDRYKREVFENYFKGAIESGGALRVIDNTNGALIGSSRYYDYDAAKRQVSVGYTFIARSHWARHFNRALKVLMLDHAFKFVDRVTFQVGKENWRSRKAMEKLGAHYLGEEAVSYYGEAAKPNVIFKIDAADWAKAKS
jgi:RimJ/RimL family protein N-acetyltransferase